MNRTENDGSGGTTLRQPARSLSNLGPSGGTAHCTIEVGALRKQVHLELIGRFQWWTFASDLGGKRVAAYSVLVGSLFGVMGTEAVLSSLAIQWQGHFLIGACRID